MQVQQWCVGVSGRRCKRLDKGAGDFVTHADIEAEHAMCAVLHRERPEDAILGEESGRSGASSGVRTWLIDPLCGTLNHVVRMRADGQDTPLAPHGRSQLVDLNFDPPFPHAPAFTAVTLAAREVLQPGHPPDSGYLSPVCSDQQ